MKNQNITSLLIVLLLLFTSSIKAVDRDFYQIKIYTIENEQQEKMMDEFLENAYIPAMHRAGVENVGVFKPIESEEMAGNLIYVFIPFESIEQFENLDTKLNKDNKYQKDGSDYINAPHDDAPYQRIESILLRSFKSFPDHGAPSHASSAGERVYELRSYQGATEKLYIKKVEMFNEGQEAQLFIDLGFQPLFFGEVMSGPDMPNLMYMITFESSDSQKEHWDSFVNSDQWNTLKSDPRYANTVSHIDKINLHPTEYSDL